MAGFGEEGHVSDFAQTVDKGNWDSVDQLRSAMINGEVDVAAAPANVAANLYNRGVDIQYIGPVVWGMLFVLGQGADGPQGDWEALRGKKVAVPLPNNMPDLVFTGILNKNGLSDKDVNIIRVQDPQQAIGMFSQGQVDYVVLPEHVATIAQAKIKKQGAQTYRALNLQEEYAKAFNTSAGFPMAGLIIRKSVAAENPGLVDTIRKEVQASIDKANAGDDATIQAISAHYDLPAEVVKQVIPRLQLKMVPAEEARQDFENFIQFLGANNPEFYGGKLPDDGFYHK